MMISFYFPLYDLKIESVLPLRKKACGKLKMISENHAFIETF